MEVLESNGRPLQCNGCDNALVQAVGLWLALSATDPLSVKKVQKCAIFLRLTHYKGDVLSLMKTKV